MKLKKIRKSKRLTQKQLSELSGIPLRTLQHYESEERDIDKANIRYICDLAKSLNVKFYDLLESEELVEKIKSTLK